MYQLVRALNKRNKGFTVIHKKKMKVARNFENIDHLHVISAIHALLYIPQKDFHHVKVVIFKWTASDRTYCAKTFPFFLHF